MNTRSGGACQNVNHQSAATRITMQEESKESSQSEFVNPEFIKTTSQLLTLTEAAFKKYAVDAYGQQVGVAKNYLWLASLIIAAQVAVIDRIDLLRYIQSNTSNFTVYFCLVFLAISIACAFKAFIEGIKVAWGSTTNESMEYVVNDWLASPFDASNIDIVLKLGSALKGSRSSLTEAMNNHDRRGSQLRSIGVNILRAVHSAWIALAFYGVSLI